MGALPNGFIVVLCYTRLTAVTRELTHKQRGAGTVVCAACGWGDWVIEDAPQRKRHMSVAFLFRRRQRLHPSCPRSA